MHLQQLIVHFINGTSIRRLVRNQDVCLPELSINRNKLLWILTSDHQVIIKKFKGEIKFYLTKSKTQLVTTYRTYVDWICNQKLILYRNRICLSI